MKTIAIILITSLMLFTNYWVIDANISNLTLEQTVELQRKAQQLDQEKALKLKKQIYVIEALFNSKKDKILKSGEVKINKFVNWVKSVEDKITSLNADLKKRIDFMNPKWYWWYISELEKLNAFLKKYREDLQVSLNSNSNTTQNSSNSSSSSSNNDIRIWANEKEKEEIRDEVKEKSLEKLSYQENQKLKEEYVSNWWEEWIYGLWQWKTPHWDTFEKCAVFHQSVYPADLSKYTWATWYEPATDLVRELDIKYGFWKSADTNRSFARVLECIKISWKNFDDYKRAYKELYDKELTIPTSPWYELTLDYVNLDWFIAKYIK